MRAVQVVAPGQAIFVDAPIPEVPPGHVLIRTTRTSLCGSDTWMLHHSPLELYPFPPGTTAHEVVGVVENLEQAQEEAKAVDVKVGDTVLVLAEGHLAMAEYMIASVNDLLVLPPGKPVEHLLQAQQLGTVLYACQNLSNLIPKTVAVIGQGSAGLWFNTTTRRLGAHRVIAVDLQGHRLAASKLYGATHTVHNAGMDRAATIEAVKECNGGELPDVVIEACGEQEAIGLALALAPYKGFVLMFGLPRPTDKFEMDYGQIFWKNLHVKACVGALSEANHTSTRMALELIANGEVDVAPMLTHSLPFEEAIEGYELHRTRDEGAIKIVIEMPRS